MFDAETRESDSQQRTLSLPTRVLRRHMGTTLWIYAISLALGLLSIWTDFRLGVPAQNDWLNFLRVGLLLLGFVSVVPLSQYLRGSRHSPAGDSREESREQKIDTLYAKLRPLMVQATGDPTLQVEVKPLLARLRRLQEEEAQELQKRFEASLQLKPGEGWAALSEAKRLLARHEAPSG